MYEHGIFSDDTIESIKDDYVWNKENDKHKNKSRDDFELQIRGVIIILPITQLIYFQKVR